MGLLRSHVDRAVGSPDGRRNLAAELGRSRLFSPTEIHHIAYAAYPLDDERPTSAALRQALERDAADFVVGADLLPVDEVAGLAADHLAQYKVVADALGERAHAARFSELLGASDGL